MADFTALKTAIQNAIKQNGNEEITGNLLQEVLLAIVTTLGDGSINDLVTALGSEATTRGNADTTLQQNINAEAQARQLADSTLQGGINTVSAAITAINNAIGNGCVYAGIATPSSTPASGKVFYLALAAGTYTNYGGLEVPQGINILKNNGSTWSLDSFLGIDDAPTPSSNKLVKSGGVFGEVMKNGSAFDLSAYNNGTTYANLNTALTALNALPAAYKKGGMSLKFVLTSDNKYVQYILTSEDFNTTPTNWVNITKLEEKIQSQKYSNTFNITQGQGHSSLNDQLNVDIKEGCLFCYTIEPTPASSLSLNRFAIGINAWYEGADSPTEIGSIVKFGRYVFVQAEHNIVKLGVTLGANIVIGNGSVAFTVLCGTDNVVQLINNSLDDYSKGTNVARFSISKPINFAPSDRTITIYKDTLIRCSNQYYSFGSNTTITIPSEFPYGSNYSVDVWFNFSTKEFVFLGRAAANNDGNCYYCFSIIMDSYRLLTLPSFMYEVDGKSIYTDKIGYISKSDNPINFDVQNKKIVVPSHTYIILGGRYFKIVSADTEIDLSSWQFNSHFVLSVFFDRITNAFVVKNSEGTADATTKAHDEYFLFYILLDENRTLSLPLNQFTVNGEYTGLVFENTIDQNITLHSYKNRFEQITLGHKTGYVEDSTPLTLIHFSDLHGNAVNLRRIVNFSSLYDTFISDVICSGDMVADAFSDDFNFWGSAGAQSIFMAIGNHDVKGTGVTKTDAYNKFFAPYIANWNVVQPTDAATLGLMYYYKDYSASKVRLIVLDCMYWDTAQKNWLVDVLEDARTNNLSVVISSHYKGGDVDYDYQSTFCSSTFRTHGGLDWDEANINSEAPDAVDTFITNGGEFVCWISGHTHIDIMGKLHDHPNQMQIVVACAAPNNAWADHRSIVGEISQDCMNVFAVDTKSKIIKMFRAGANLDRFMRKTEAVCYDYQSKEYLYSY